MPAKALYRTLSLATLCLAAAAVNPAAAEPAVRDAQAFQDLLQKSIDTKSPVWVIPYYGAGAPERKFAHRLLDELWSNKAYRIHLSTWLASKPESADDKLLSDWYVAYQKAFTLSFDLLNDDAIKQLWRLRDPNTVYALDRAACAKTIREVESMLSAAHDTFLTEHTDKLAVALGTAIAREFDREDHPQPGDRPVAGVMAGVAVRTLRAVAATLPGTDGQQLIDAYSYRPDAPPMTPPQMCERAWIVARGVEDSSLQSQGVSASLMRRTMTATAYGSDFQRLNKKLQ